MSCDMHGFMAKKRSGASVSVKAKATKKGKQAKSVAPQGKKILTGKVEDKQVHPGKIKG